MPACRLLVGKLNRDGAAWGEPVPGKGIVDCEAFDNDEPTKRLAIQVVRANTDPNLWKALNTHKRVSQLQTPQMELADQLKQAIEKKANKIQLGLREGLMLALDATRLPALAFDEVVLLFERQFGLWAKSLGFEGIWLVGPVDELISRLDRISNGLP